MNRQYLSADSVEIDIRSEHGNFYAAKSDLIIEDGQIFIMIEGEKTRIYEENIYEI